ncbi:hypothetical protein RCL_jg11248.t1 [Rhizophagus clarus]|uniref:Uncharacterized protein n=1 Tax=Rhizophagus clarus TaxID=94130 RepID=A0A8H3LKD2_9GLOM|nr:hypothetical protein RCL_jg11248.t1 [Rhizophagus clarus]
MVYSQHGTLPWQTNNTNPFYRECCCIHQRHVYKYDHVHKKPTDTTITQIHTTQNTNTLTISMTLSIKRIHYRWFNDLTRTVFSNRLGLFICGRPKKPKKNIGLKGRSRKQIHEGLANQIKPQPTEKYNRPEMNRANVDDPTSPCKYAYKKNLCNYQLLPPTQFKPSTIKKQEQRRLRHETAQSTNIDALPSHTITPTNFHNLSTPKGHTATLLTIPLQDPKTFEASLLTPPSTPRQANKAQARSLRSASGNITIDQDITIVSADTSNPQDSHEDNAHRLEMQVEGNTSDNTTRKIRKTRKPSKQ